MNPRMDRRKFFGRAALVAGGAALTGVLPWRGTRALAADPSAATSLGSERSDATASVEPALADWSIDDQWAPAPRYADPIGYGGGGSAALADARGIGGATEPALSAVGSLDALFHS
jgi:hypothetical protein